MRNNPMNFMNNFFGLKNRILTQFGQIYLFLSLETPVVEMFVVNF